MLKAAVSAPTYATTVTALKVAGVVTGAYGTYQAASNGMYATAVVTATLTAFAAYSLLEGLQGSAQGGNEGGGLSQQGQLDFAQAEYGQRFSSGEGSIQYADARGVVLNDAGGTNRTDIGNLDQADPAFRARVERTLDRVRREGYKRRVASGVRTLKEQIALVRAGRWTTLDSPHVWGFGADIIDARWGWNVPAGSTFWQDLRVAAQAEGLVSGGTWTRFPDPAHVEMPGWRYLR